MHKFWWTLGFSQRLLTCKNPPHSFLWSPGPQTLDRKTGEQFILKVSSEDNRRRGMTITKHQYFSIHSKIKWRLTHVYMRVWTPQLGERLIARRNRSNMMESLAVDVFKNGTLVDHAPR